MATTMLPNTQESIEQSNSKDVFSMTDDALARRFTFEHEHGVGNWGSVWRATDKRTESAKKVAIKVVHRSKSPTTAARVRALWNEMKSIRSLRESGQAHRSIIWFDCFIITPSYALIVMDFLPTLLPVPVDEATAKPWMTSLASALQFMHDRGVVHNDIKPANIILSSSNIPILVDFGFSERYDFKLNPDPDSGASSSAFLSSLAYGTPEYLAPERASGTLHDTRKADVWSLGVTFFEMIFNRTPFEKERDLSGDTDAPAVDKAAMDAYWARTVKGKWYGTKSSPLRSKISSELEALLRRMIIPNADVRYTSSQVVRDPYWNGLPHATASKSTSTASGNAIAGVVRTVLGNKLDATPKKGTTKPLQTSPVISRSADNKPGKENKASASVDANATPNEAISGGPQSRKPLRRALKQEEAVLDIKDTTPKDSSQSSRPFSRVPPTSYSPTTTLRPEEISRSRPRAADILSPSNLKRSISPIQHSPIGNSADLGGPTQTLRHVVSANYPFNSKSADGSNVSYRKEVEAGTLGTRFEVRKIKSDLTSTQTQTQTQTLRRTQKIVCLNDMGDKENRRIQHSRTPSYNSMYLRGNHLAVPVIPEVRVEDADDIGKQSQLVIAAGTVPDPAAKAQYYEQLIVRGNAVERVGKGYQSNLCVQNKPLMSNVDPMQELKSIQRKSSKNAFFMSVRDRSQVPKADGSDTVVPPARPRRKMRQAASFDGLRNFAREKAVGAPARPVSAHLTNSRDLCGATLDGAAASKEKKRGAVTTTVRKAFLAIIGGGERAKAV